MEQNSKENNILSDTIEILRFPLAIAVVYIHIGPNVINLLDADFNLFSHKGLLNLLGITFSHVLTHIAVPCFFLISGLLFFINMKEWNWIQYRNKLKSRVRTLLIPYVVWNITPWILMLIGYYIKGILVDNSLDKLIEYTNEYNLNILYNCHHWGETKINWIGENLLMTGPYDLPLWFLRDLIFMIILAPVIYLFIKKFKLWYIAILFIAYISRIWTSIPGLQISACFFFSLGAFFSISNIKILPTIQKYRYTIIPLSIILLLVNISYDGVNTIIGQNIYPFFIITTVLSVFYLTSELVKKYKFMANKFLVSSCFFIYACHKVIIPYLGSPLDICSKILGYILPGMPIIRYLTTPFLTIFVCMSIMQICKKLLPGIIKWYTGNR